MQRVFQGESGPYRDVVLINSAAVMLAADHVDNIPDGVAQAAKIIDDGLALDKLNSLISISQQIGREIEGDG